MALKYSDLLKPRKSENDGIGRKTNVGEVEGRECRRERHKNKDTVMWHRN